LPRQTKEEKLAETIANLIADHRTDLDEVGVHLARMVPKTTYNRLLIITESAEHEMENNINARTHHPLF
jgi:hypothetical protein